MFDLFAKWEKKTFSEKTNISFQKLQDNAKQ